MEERRNTPSSRRLDVPRAARVGALANAMGIVASGAIVGAALVACSAPVGADPSANGAQRLAVVDVRVAQTPSGDVLHVDAAARFVAVRETPSTASTAPAHVPSTSDALDLLGLRYPDVPLGACAAAEAGPLVDAARVSPIRVDLRDLSPVTLDLRGDDGILAPLRLEPRAFPDVGGLVSGVVFVTRPDAPSIDRASAVRVGTLTVGGNRIGDLDLPELPSSVQLVAATTTTASGADAWLVDARGLDAHVATSLQPTDRVAVDVVRAGVVRARCGTDEGGHLHLDAASLGGIGDATLVVRTQRRVFHDDGSLGRVDARIERDVELKLIVR